MTEIEIIKNDLIKNIDITYKELDLCPQDYINYRLLQNQVVIMESLLKLLLNT